jgi:protocatechuate 3,4-dioxygenase beta subunit
VLAAGYQTQLVGVQGDNTARVVVVRLTQAGGQPGVFLDSSGQPVSEFIDGRVVDDESGEPVAEYVVQSSTLNPAKPDDVFWQQYTAGNAQNPGVFNLPRPTPNRMWRILAIGHVPQVLSEQSVPDTSSASPLLVRLKRGGMLRGVVVDDNGQPVSGARVLMATGKNVWLMDGKPEYGRFQGGSTNTDEAGHFVLRGEGDTSERLVVISPDGQMVWPVIPSAPGQEVKITLPKPGTLIVHYNIPGDAPEAKPELYLRTTNKDTLLWTNISFGQSVVVRNGGETVLTNLTPGTYFFRRYKRDGNRGAESEAQTVLVEADQTAHADMVRTNGQSIRGKVLGLDEAKSSGGYIYVKSSDATGLPWPQRSRNEQNEFKYRTFDVSQFGADGTFQTAMLKAGTYTVVADVYPPGDGNTGSNMRNSNPDYVAVAKITVTYEAMPSVTLKLAQAQYVDIAGSVMDDVTGRPVENAYIESGTVNPKNPGTINWNQGYQGTASGGRFSLWGQKAGTALRFRAPGYVPQIFTREEIIASRQTANLQVRFKRGEELSGVVLDHAGQPVAHAKVYLCPLELGFVRFGEEGSSSDSSRTVTYWAHTYATTDRAGHFTLRGVDGNQTRVIVVTDDGQMVQHPASAGFVATFLADTAAGQMVQPVQVSLPAQDLKITLPEPATLIVHYDIPGDVAETDFGLTLHTNELELPLWKYITLKPHGKVSNGGQTIMTNLLPGTYDFSRSKFGGPVGHEYAFIFGDPFKFVQFDTQTIVLKPGQTQQVNMVRSTGQRVQGQVTGLAAITNTAGAFLYVASANAINNPNDFKTNNLEPCYDAVFFVTNELFQTALLEPGKYTLITEVYAWGKPPKRELIPDDQPQYGDMGWFNPQQLAYVGSTNITVTAKAAPPVKIELHPWVEPSKQP